MAGVCQELAAKIKSHLRWSPASMGRNSTPPWARRAGEKKTLILAPAGTPLTKSSLGSLARSGDARLMANMGGNTMRLLHVILAALSVALVANDAQADTLFGSYSAPDVFIGQLFFTDPNLNSGFNFSIQHFEFESVPHAVPIPNVGAGLPALVLAGGLLGWWRRRRQSRMNLA
jgi:hypothetical protein